MQRSCPHCGQAQNVAEEDIVAPWVFTKCNGCGNLSVVRRQAISGASAREPAQAKARAQAILRKREERVRMHAQVPSRETRAHAPAVEGGATFERAQPERLSATAITTDSQEWRNAHPPTPPAFLRKKNEERIEAEISQLIGPRPDEPTKRFDFRPIGAILIAIGLTLIGIKHYQSAPPPTPIENQEVVATMSAPARVEPTVHAAPPVAAEVKAPAPQFFMVRVVREGSLLRTGPGQGFDKLGSLSQGTKLIVRKWESGWFQVELEDPITANLGIGWIRGDLIQQDGG